jgi:hypothetical protein
MHILGGQHALDAMDAQIFTSALRNSSSVKNQLIKIYQNDDWTAPL